MALESRMYMLGSNSKSLPKELEHGVRHEAGKEEGASSLISFTRKPIKVQQRG